MRNTGTMLRVGKGGRGWCNGCNAPTTRHRAGCGRNRVIGVTAAFLERGLDADGLGRLWSDSTCEECGYVVHAPTCSEFIAEKRAHEPNDGWIKMRLMYIGKPSELEHEEQLRDGWARVENVADYGFNPALPLEAYEYNETCGLIWNADGWWYTQMPDQAQPGRRRTRLDAMLAVEASQARADDEWELYILHGYPYVYRRKDGRAAVWARTGTPRRFFAGTPNTNHAGHFASDPEANGGTDWMEQPHHDTPEAAMAWADEQLSKGA